MFAVIRTGGKQYRVKPDDVIEVERLAGEAGDTVEISEVLMVGDDKGVEVGSPLVEGACVAAELVEQKRGPKIIVFKKKRRQGYRRRKGHRQDLTRLKISEILTGGKKPTKAAKAKPAAKKTAEKKPAAAKKTAAKAKAKAGDGDDLTRINGVGPVIVGKLADLGYTTFRQIAELDAKKIAEIEEKLSFKGRIEREKWVEQAKKLAAGD